MLSVRKVRRCGMSTTADVNIHFWDDAHTRNFVLLKYGRNFECFLFLRNFWLLKTRGVLKGCKFPSICFFCVLGSVLFFWFVLTCVLFFFLCERLKEFRTKGFLDSKWYVELCENFKGWITLVELWFDSWFFERNSLLWFVNMGWE